MPFISEIDTKLARAQFYNSMMDITRNHLVHMRSPAQGDIGEGSMLLSSEMNKCAHVVTEVIRRQVEFHTALHAPAGR